MKINKGDWFRCTKDVLMKVYTNGGCAVVPGLKEYSKGSIYRSEKNGFITNNSGNKYHSWEDDINLTDKYFTKLYTIQDLKDGKVAVENDGTVEDLNKVLISAFPDDVGSSGLNLIYERVKEGEWGGRADSSLPNQSVKDFLAQLSKEEKTWPTQKTKDKLDKIAEDAKAMLEKIAEGAKTKPKDPINPDHYKSYSVETIDMMVAIYGKEKTAIHCELTAFKYRQRLGKKDSLDQDLAKEEWYLNKAKELRNDNSVTKL